MKNRQSRVREVNSEELMTEFLMNALRLTSGFDLSLFEQRCHQSRSQLEPFMLRALDKKFINVEKDRIIHTKKGSLFLNELVLLA